MTQNMIREVMSTPYSIVRESMVSSLSVDYDMTFCVHVCQKNGNAQQCFTTFLLGELSEDGRLDDDTAWDIKGAATVLYLGMGTQITNDGSSSADMITIAGSDTVSINSTPVIRDAYLHSQTMTTLISFILTMVLHRHIFKKAQAELDSVIGSERLPNLDDRDSLPYLECVLKEVYRSAP